jgi:ubiquinone/menaquinone biosynthesis C-methylase UbiE
VTTIRTFQDFRDAIAGYRLPRILLTALDLDLFTVIGAQTWSLASLARHLRASPRGLEILCRNLASVGLLVKSRGRYRNSLFAETVLNAKHAGYRGDYLKLLQGQWDDWSTLTRSVCLGQPVVAGEELDETAYRRQFTWAMHHRSMDVAPRLARQLDLHRARTLLDLGGGPGTYALAFLKKNLRLRATVCDRAPALAVAREIAEQSPMGHHLSYLPLDFMKGPIPGRYDVVWLSNVIHIYSPAENQKLLRKIARVLPPGGRLLIQEAFLHDHNGLAPLGANLFAVTMLLFTDRGNTYSVREVTDWLMRTGFQRVSLLNMKAGTGDWEGGILEAVR